MKAKRINIYRNYLNNNPKEKYTLNVRLYLTEDERNEYLKDMTIYIFSKGGVK